MGKSDRGKKPDQFVIAVAQAVAHWAGSNSWGKTAARSSVVSPRAKQRSERQTAAASVAALGKSSSPSSRYQQQKCSSTGKKEEGSGWSSRAAGMSEGG